jgi:hypothetical protein
MGPRFAAGIVALAIAVACPRIARAQSGAEGNVNFARQRFRRGVELYAAAQYGDALAEFRNAQALYSSPNSRLAIARCLRELGRYDEAVEAYEQAASAASDLATRDVRYAPTRDDARSEGAAIEQRVGRLRVIVPEAPPDVRVHVGTREVPRAALGLSLPVMPGRVVIETTARGFATAHEQATVEAGREVRVTIVLRREFHATQTPARTAAPIVAPRTVRTSTPPRTGAWTLLVVGGVVLAASGGLALWANAQYDAVIRMCGGPPCNGFPDTARLGQDLAIATYTSLGVGAASLAVSLVLFALPARTSAARIAVAPTRVSVVVAF